MGYILYLMLMFWSLHFHCARIPKEKKMREMFPAYNSYQSNGTTSIWQEMRGMDVPEKVTHLLSNYI